MRILAAALGLSLLLAAPASAQDNLEIFGYAQASFTNFSNRWQFEPPPGEKDYNYNFMGIGQMNLMLSKNLGKDVRAFVNFELINDYSSSKGFGSFGLQEAYIRWDYRDYLKVKLGMFLPQFNAMLEIYNRTPLLPYLVRPKLYEANNGNLYDIFDILPQKALVQVNGNIPVGDLVMEYAMFLGNPVNRFISSPGNDLIPGYVALGQSAVRYMGWGGRAGITWEGLRAGFSFSSDVENQRRFVTNSETLVEADLGDLDRYRIGADVSFSAGPVTVAGEYLMTSTTIPAAVKDSLAVWHEADPYFIGGDFEKKFWYVSVVYAVTPELSLFAMKDLLNDNANPFFFGLDGYGGWSFGGSYSATEALVLKVQTYFNSSRYDTGEPVNPVRDFNDRYLAFGASFSF